MHVGVLAKRGEHGGPVARQTLREVHDDVAQPEAVRVVAGELLHGRPDQILLVREVLLQLFASHGMEANHIRRPRALRAQTRAGLRRHVT